MKLYYDPITVNCRKVLAGFDLIGTEFETVHVDYFTGGQKAPEYLAVNPNATLPTLADGDFILWESNAILQYAADKKGNTAVYPTDLKTRADIHRWQLWEAAHWFPACYVYLVENVVKPLLKAEPDKSITDKQDPVFHNYAAILDARLAKQPWVCGQSVTIADISLAAPMHLHKYQKLPLQEHPNLRAWMSRVEALPCWQKTDVASKLGLT
ncbi:MAG: glutathione S-transferase family protein [Burkholderiales bacterium]